RQTQCVGECARRANYAAIGHPEDLFNLPSDQRLVFHDKHAFVRQWHEVASLMVEVRLVQLEKRSRIEHSSPASGISNSVTPHRHFMERATTHGIFCLFTWRSRASEQFASLSIVTRRLLIGIPKAVRKELPRWPLPPPGCSSEDDRPEA